MHQFFELPEYDATMFSPIPGMFKKLLTCQIRLSIPSDLSFYHLAPVAMEAVGAGTQQAL